VHRDDFLGETRFVAVGETLGIDCCNDCRTARGAEEATLERRVRRGRNTVDRSSTRREEREARFLGHSVHGLCAGLESTEPSDGSIFIRRPGASTPPKQYLASRAYIE